MLTTAGNNPLIFNNRTFDSNFSERSCEKTNDMLNTTRTMLLAWQHYSTVLNMTRVHLSCYKKYPIHFNPVKAVSFNCATAQYDNTT